METQVFRIFVCFKPEVCLRRRRPLLAIWHGETSIEGGDWKVSTYLGGFFGNLIDPRNVTNSPMKITIFPAKYHKKWWIFHGYVSLQECSPGKLMIERLVSFWDCLFLGRTSKFLGCRCLLFHKTLNGTESPRTMVRCDQALRWRFLKDRWWFQICSIFKFDTYCILQLGWFNHHL